MHAHHTSWLTLVVVSTGCVGQPPPAPPHGDNVGTTMVLDGSSTTAVLGGGSYGSSSGEGSSSEGSGSEGKGSSTTTPSDPDTGTTTESLPMARSCQELLEQEPSSPTGVYAILSTSDGTAVDVYCEMALDGGGWTLVARSAPGAAGPFGWGVSRGTLGDESEPYALDAMGIALPFGEILITRREGFAEPVERAYLVEVPEGFIEDYRDGAYGAEDARTVLGDCDPADGPTMLLWWGYTENEEHYFFRDIAGPPGQLGLFPNEIVTYFDDCEQGGWLDDQQGALFVR